MDTAQLKIHLPSLSRSPLVISDPIELRGFSWSLHGSRTGGGFDFLVHCKPVDREVLCKFQAEVVYKVENHLIVYKFTINHYLMTDNIYETETYQNISCSSDTFVITLNILSFELIPKHSFNFWNDHLTDIELVVGDKKFYSSKQILGQFSKKFYEMIYNGDEDVDRIEIFESSWPIFHRFLEILHGLDQRKIEKKDLIKFVELSIFFESSRCIRRCEASFFDLSDNDKYDLTYDAEESTENLMTFFKNLLNKWLTECQNYRLDSPLEQIIGDRANWTKVVHLTNVPFRIVSKYDEHKEQQEVTINCLYKDSSDFWVVLAFINNLGVRTYMNFTSTSSHTIAIKKDEKKDLGFDMIWKSYPEENIDFSIHRDNLTDVVLSVGDKKFHVSRQILASASTYFYNMFYAGYQEQDKTDIPLIGIDKDDFEEFLQHVYIPKRVVEKSKLGLLLELSQFYTATGIYEKCMEYINDPQINDAQRIVLCVEHNLDDVLKTLGFKIKNSGNFVSLSKLDGFDEIDAATLARIKLNVEDE